MLSSFFLFALAFVVSDGDFNPFVGKWPHTFDFEEVILCNLFFCVGPQTNFSELSLKRGDSGEGGAKKEVSKVVVFPKL